MSDGSISLILPNAQDDELALGLMFRIARLNGAPNRRLEDSIKGLAKGEGSSTLIAGLAKAYGQSPSAFAQRHTLLPFRHAFSKQELQFDDAYWTSGHMWRRATPIMVGPEMRFCEMCAAADDRVLALPKRYYGGPIEEPSNGPTRCSQPQLLDTSNNYPNHRYFACAT